MTNTGKPVDKHYQSAREHLAGVKASQAWVQELTAAHLLRTQQPISGQPYPAEQQGEQ
jgi:hypothetical protein